VKVGAARLGQGVAASIRVRTHLALKGGVPFNFQLSVSARIMAV
jgi:hypothetical protein